MNFIRTLWLNRPGAVMAFVNALIALGLAFGLELSVEQVGAIIAALSMSFGLFSDTVSVSRVGLMKLAEATDTHAHPDTPHTNTPHHL